MLSLNKRSFNKYCVLSSLLLLSCKQSILKEELGTFHGAHIELMLDSMQTGFPKNDMTSIKQSQYIYVSYIDSITCTSCALSHLSDWHALTENISQSSFTNIFIIAPSKNEKEKVIENISKNLIDGNRIYIDTSMVFERHNPNLPKTQLAHTFLIDKDRKVILIGDPLKNIRVEEIFNNIIRNNKNKIK